MAWKAFRSPDSFEYAYNYLNNPLVLNFIDTRKYYRKCIEDYYGVKISTPDKTPSPFLFGYDTQMRLMESMKESDEE
jgi:hypothetical protein